MLRWWLSTWLWQIYHDLVYHVLIDLHCWIRLVIDDDGYRSYFIGIFHSLAETRNEIKWIHCKVIYHNSLRLSCVFLVQIIHKTSFLIIGWPWSNYWRNKIELNLDFHILIDSRSISLQLESLWAKMVGQRETKHTQEWAQHTKERWSSRALKPLGCWLKLIITVRVNGLIWTT